MGGGITGIRKPHAIAPTGGPQFPLFSSPPSSFPYNNYYKFHIYINHSRMLDTR